MFFERYHKSFSSFLLLLLFGTGVSSCSVYEDRRACPCLLNLSVDNPANDVCDSIVFLLGGENFADSFRVSRDAGIVQRKISYRGELRINAVCGEASSDISGGDLVIPVGEQCPEAYLYGKNCRIDSEEHYEDVRLAKNYCGVSMTFVTETADKYIVEVLGCVCGYDSEGGLIDGDFAYSPEFSDSSESFFRIPRQKDASLRLAIITGASPGGTAPTEETAHYFALGNYIEQSGYDWTKTDLDDIALSIDFASCTISLTVNDWEKEFEIDVVI